MKVSRRKFLKGTAVSAAGLALVGCRYDADLMEILRKFTKHDTSASTGSSESTPEPSSTPTEGTAPESTPAPTSTPSLPTYYANVLTGEKRNAAAGDHRIVGIMVNNISNSARQNSRPQRGLSDAKILIESKVEGNITRFCALYDVASDIPEVGPIRSGRDQFLQLIMPWKALYYHDGESIFCTQFIKNWEYWDLNLGGKSYFDTPTHAIVSHRDSRGGVVAYEHTEFTSGTEICKAANAAGISLEQSYTDTFFPFADYRTNAYNNLSGCSTARGIKVRHSANYRTSFVYDAWKKTYKMRQYSAATKTVTDTVDENNDKTLTFTNVLICFADIAAYAGDSADVQSVDYASGGEAYLFTNGRVKVCRWSKDAPNTKLRIYDPNKPNETIYFNVGKTYIGIVDTDERDSFAYGSTAEAE
jgi:hypothetical protein